MQVAATISAVVAAGVAVLVLVALRDIRLDADAEEADEPDRATEPGRHPVPERRVSGTPVPEA
jgi:hypothetical protein